MNYKTMRENNLQVCTEDVSKSYTIENVSISASIIDALRSAGFKYIEVSFTGSVSAFKGELYSLCSWQRIEPLPAPSEFDFYELQLEDVVYQIA